MSKLEEAKLKLKQQEEEIRKIEELEKQEAEDEKKEAIFTQKLSKPISKPSAQNTSAVLAQKLKEAQEADAKLKQTNQKIAELQAKKQALNASLVQKTNITTIISNPVPPNLGTPVHSSKAENEN